MNQEYQLKKLRVILLDETKPNAERVAAQKSIMKILNLKEKETDGQCTPEKVDNLRLEEGGLNKI